MEENKKESKAIDKVTEEIDKRIKRTLEEGVETHNIDFLCKMIDIKKDITEMEKEEQEMMYRNYGNYGKYEDNRYGRRMRDSRGRYMAGHNEYMSDDPMRTLMSSYEAYSDSKYAYHDGNYGHKEEAITNLDYMLQSVVDFMEMLKKDVGSREEMDLIKRYSKQISEM